MAEKTVGGEIEANPAPKYEDHDGPQRVGADTGTAYPIPDTGASEPPAEVVIETPGGDTEKSKKKGQAK